MLDDSRMRRTGWLMAITILFTIIAWLTLQVGLYKGEVKTANVIKSYTEAQNADLQEVANYYQRLHSKAVIILRDGQITLQKGTIVIPPQKGEQTE